MSFSDLTDDADEVPDEVLLTSSTFPTPLQIFAGVGGLALLAEHLPLLYPEISRQITAAESGESTPNMTNGADTSNDWVTVDNYPEDLYTVRISALFLNRFFNPIYEEGGGLYKWNSSVCRSV